MEDEKQAIRAIRLKCLDCSGGSASEVEACEVEECPLFTFRLGKVPEKPRRKKVDKSQSLKLILPGL